jgi:hypothetical protein
MGISKPPIKRWLAAAALVLAGAGTVACGPDSPSAKVANVSPKPMPSKASWEGVYYDVLFGELHLVEEGNTITGKWQRPLKAQWGKVDGTVDGNVMRFSWEEYVDGLAGPNSRKKGKGYFVYSRPAGDNVDDVIDGEIGRGEDELGIEWHAIKQRQRKPDLDSIGSQGAGEVGGGDWDSKPSDDDDDDDVEKPREPDSDEEGSDL